MPVHLIGRENTKEWLVERVRRELVVNKARNAMVEQDKVKEITYQAVYVMAELDWEQRNTDRFPFGPVAETKRLAIILTQRELGADKRLIEDLQKQRSRPVCGIVLDHEKRDFTEMWRHLHLHTMAMSELLHQAGAYHEAARSLLSRLRALEQQGITPSYDHYGLTQHFDLEWRRARVYPAKTRAPAPVDALPAFAISRTLFCMMNRGQEERKQAEGDEEPGIELGTEGIAHEPPAAFVSEAAPAPLDIEQGASPALHHLEADEIEGTSLDGTYLSHFEDLRQWLNVLQLYGPTLSCLRKWYWGGGGRWQVRSGRGSRTVDFTGGSRCPGGGG